ncbi:MAG TPA: hypothetical protein PKD59_15190 [Miltoncostaeaceae bacterium]|nr:hypothetical protein [Miltoncostaeaceae bacterium]
MSWWDRNVVEPQKLPLLMLLLAFIVTFLVTRTITRSIRAGRGPFRDIDPAGVHLHHSIPGLILLTAGAVASVAVPPHVGWRSLAAVAIGVGASLVFDEFAMLLHLDDDYWRAEGRQSVQAVGLVTACLVLAVVGFVPFGVEDVGPRELGVRWGVVGLEALTVCAVVVCALKGKYRLALVSVFMPPVAAVGAVRLARPGSLWARRHYAGSSATLALATRRAEEFDRRWDPMWRRIGNVVAGAPDP